MELLHLYNRITSNLLSVNDRELISFGLSSSLKQDQLDKFLEHWDIEKEGAVKALILAYVKKAHPELVFSSYTGPRLNGLLDYYRCRNLKLMASCKHICTALAENGIDFMPIKGGAMKALRPDLPRNMSDIDILVRESDYSKAVSVAALLGYNVVRNGHSSDIHQKGSTEGMVDIHRYVPLNSGKGRKLNSGFFSRAGHADIFGVKGLAPSAEDQLFIILANLSRNIMDGTASRRIAINMFDISFLVRSKADFDWNAVLDNCALTSSLAEICFAAGCVNSLVPGMIPEFPSGLLTEKEMSDFATLVEFRRFVLRPLQLRSHELGVGKVLTHPSMIPDFIKVRPLYTSLKLIKHSSRAAVVLYSPLKKYVAAL